MKTISVGKLFEGKPDLLKTLHTILNMPLEVKNVILKDFCNHPQMKPILKKHGLLPMYLYYVLTLSDI